MKNNGQKRVFTIPINNLTREEAEKQIRNLISNHEVTIDKKYIDIFNDEEKEDDKQFEEGFEEEG